MERFGTHYKIPFSQEVKNISHKQKYVRRHYQNIIYIIKIIQCKISKTLFEHKG